MQHFDLPYEFLPSRNDAASVVNALTIDFEDWYHGLEIPYARWGQYEKRIDESGRRVLAILSEMNVRATFFILGWVADRYPHLVREIVAHGHEVGTHGYSHTLVYQQTPATLRAELRSSIDILEQLTGKPVVGHRAPFFSITHDALWVLELLWELGITYDSSIFPVHNYRYGIHDAPRWPYRVNLGERQIVEFPPSVWRKGGLNVPMSGGAYFRIYPYAFTRYVIQAINALGHAAVFYLHPWELDPQHPHIRLPKRIALTHYYNLDSTEKRLRQLLTDFRFAPMGEVLASSGMRESAPFVPSLTNGVAHMEQP